MQKELATIPSFVLSRTAGESITRNVILVISASILIALSAQVSVPIPLSPVPMTLQPFAILLIGATLGARRGFAAALLYLVEGAMGLPVFAQGKGGAFWLIAGPTAGFLLAFPFAAWITGWFSERGWMKTAGGTALGMALAIALIHLSGWSWLAAVMGLGAREAFAIGTAPFLIGDVVKIALAAALLPMVQRFVGRRAA